MDDLVDMSTSSASLDLGLLTNVNFESQPDQPVTEDDQQDRPSESSTPLNPSPWITEERIIIPDNSVPKLDKKIGRRMYLCTYSRCDLIRFPTRRSFGEFVAAAFNAAFIAGKSKVKVLKWAVCREPHNDGSFHYHCALKLDGIKKWFSPWKNMYENGVCIDFSDKHDYYISMYRYVTKEDDEAYIFPLDVTTDLDHITSPRTKTCNAVNRRRQAEKRKSADAAAAATDSGKEKTEMRRSWNNKLTNLDVGDFIVKRNISTKTELYAIANQRKEDGECDLAMYLFSKSEKVLAELIHKAWSLHTAPKQLSEESKCRMDRLQDALEGECVVEGCLWLKLALEVLKFNNIDKIEFAKYMFKAMELGRKKFNNIMIVGPSNTAKTFLLKPLQVIFKGKLFENPTNDKYGWSGIQNSQVVLLQDFRYSRELIAWSDFLLLLEGETVKLPTPKNHSADDIHLPCSNDMPIFATSRGKIEFSRFSPHYIEETEMMNSRWNVITLKHVFQEKDIKEVAPCGRCFADLISSRI